MPGSITSSPSPANRVSLNSSSAASSAAPAKCLSAAPSATRPAAESDEELPDSQGGPAGAVPVDVEAWIDLHHLETCHHGRLPRHAGTGQELLRGQTEHVGSA